MADDSFDIDIPDEQPMDEPIVQDAVSEAPPERAEAPEPTEAAPDADEPRSAAEEPTGEEEDAPQESRAQKRIRQEIDKRKALETQLATNNQQIEQQRLQLQDLIGRLTPPAEEAAAAPEYDDDPAAHLLHKQQELQQRVDTQDQINRQQAEQQQQNAQMAQTQQRYEALEADFAKGHPDYYQRIDGLKAQRMQMWEQLGLPRDQAMHQVQQEAWSLVQQGLQTGQNPAEVFYSMAPQAATPPAQPVAEQVMESARLQEQATSLGTRGSARNRYTVSDLSSMDAAEFDKVTSGANWEKLVKSLGG